MALNVMETLEAEWVCALKTANPTYVLEALVEVNAIKLHSMPSYESELDGTQI